MRLPRLAPLLLVGALAACVSNPVTRGRDLVFVSQEDEIAIGAEAAEQVASEMGLVEDEALVALIEGVGERVAAAAPQQGYPYSFEIVDRVEPNAFALPGGHIYVSRGLLALTRDEDELANVLAHEIVHVAARHHAQRQARATGVGILALPGLLVGGLLGGPVGSLVRAPFALAGAGAITSYSRGQELEADEHGQRIAAAAGYDAAGLADFLETLEGDEKLRGEGPHRPSWFDSHPATPQRAAEARTRAAQAGAPTRSASAQQSYLEQLDGLLLGDNPDEGVFDGQRFLHPGLDFTLVFPEGWKTANTRRAVGAYLESGEAQLALELEPRAGSAREAANSFLADLGQKTRVDVARVETLEIAGAQAVRAQLLAATRRGPVALDATWIAHGGRIYRLAGVVPRGYDDAYRRSFGQVGASFAALTAAQRRQIREARLRLRQARAGESLAELGARTGNRWSPERTALVNGLTPDARLAAGQWVKLAIEQPHSP